MEIIVGLLILGVVLFAIQKKVSKTTPIVEEIKEEAAKAEEAKVNVDDAKAAVEVVKTKAKKTTAKVAETKVAAKVTKPRATKKTSV
jgi:hypothetical protein